MTANQAIARATLAHMGVPDDALDDGVKAVEDVLDTYGPDPTSEQWECAAEFVGTFHAITGIDGPGLRQARSLARAAYKMQR